MNTLPGRPTRVFVHVHALTCVLCAALCLSMGFVGEVCMFMDASLVRHACSWINSCLAYIILFNKLQLKVVLGLVRWFESSRLCCCGIVGGGGEVVELNTTHICWLLRGGGAAALCFL